MARVTTGQKAQRVIRFLMGLRRPRVAGALSSYGFTQETLDEGWTLLRALVGEKMATPAPPARPDPALLERLDDWENKWFVIAEATLRRHHPEVADAVFLNLSRTSGPELAVSVATFLDRVAALESGTEREQQAHALLLRRGLTPAIIARAQEYIDAIGAVSSEAPPVIDEAAIAAAEEEMWRWYLEWSSISRIAIRDGRMLRTLGFGTSGRSDEEDDDTEQDPAPAF